MFSVYYKNRWIGAVAIYDVADGGAEFGRLLIDRAAAGRGGLGVAAVKAACQIAFVHLNVERIFLEVYCDNPSAQITYLKAGFCPAYISQDDGQTPMVHMRLLKHKKSVDGESKKFSNIEKNRGNDMSIQVLKPKFEVDECLAEIRECLEAGWSGMGYKTVEFEEAWKQYTGHSHAYFLNSNTVACV